MDRLFRTYANFDVEAGLFSFYSELSLKNGTITGYVKPLFRDIKARCRVGTDHCSPFEPL